VYLSCYALEKFVYFEQDIRTYLYSLKISIVH